MVDHQTEVLLVKHLNAKTNDVGVVDDDMHMAILSKRERSLCSAHSHCRPGESEDKHAHESDCC